MIIDAYISTFIPYALQDRIAAKVKAEVKTLEDTLNQLEEKLSKKKADNRPQAASTPVSLILPQSEQVSHAVWFSQKALSVTSLLSASFNLASSRRGLGEKEVSMTCCVHVRLITTVQSNICLLSAQYKQCACVTMEQTLPCRMLLTSEYLHFRPVL
jgi:hypothetical protein